MPGQSSWGSKRGASALQATSPAGPPSLNYDDIVAAIDKRLFVGKVPPGTTEDELLKIYEAFGAIRECRVVPDRNGSSNGIAFVSYDTWSSTHRALLETDGSQKLSGHEGTPSALVASFAERTSNVGRGGGLAYAKGLDISRVFVGSLPEDATEAELTERFSAVGAVETAAMLPAKGRRRCGYVTFQIWGEALDAVEALHGLPLREGGDPMTVVLAQPKEANGAATTVAPRSSTAQAVEPPAKWRRTEPAAAAAAAPAGSADLLSQLLSAYVVAVNSQSPTAACDLIHDQIMKTRDQLRSSRGTTVDARARAPAAPVASSGQPGDPNKARLFVGGLPHDSTDEDLASLASQLSFPGLRRESCKLIECRVLPGKGCGYLRYASWEAAEEAFDALQGRQVEGWSQVLRLQWASPKGGSQGQRQPPPVPSAADPSNVDPLAYASPADIEAQGSDPTRLFVGQIARECDAHVSLKPLFEHHGHLQEFRWVQEKGVLYVTYADCSEAQAAMKTLSGFSSPGVSKGLNVKFSQRRAPDERPRRDGEPRHLR